MSVQFLTCWTGVILYPASKLMSPADPFHPELSFDPIPVILPELQSSEALTVFAAGSVADTVDVGSAAGKGTFGGVY